MTVLSHMHYTEAVNLLIGIIKLHLVRQKKIRKNKKSLKHRTPEDELHNAKHQKLIIVDAIDTLRKRLIFETRNVDQKQDMPCVAKAAALCSSIEEKEKQLEECSAKINQKTF